MATLPEANEWPVGIYQLELNDPVLGGPPNEATKAGVDNIPHQQLAKRTNWLKIRMDQLLSTVVAATTLVAGIVRLSSAVNSTSETLAATPAAVKSVNDNANGRALKTTTITGGGLAGGGGSLANDQVISVTDATQAEAEAGTSLASAMSPLRVAQAIRAASAGAFSGETGYQRLPSGLIIQWGVGSSGSDGRGSAVFPIAFPTQAFTVICTDRSEDYDAARAHIISAISMTRTGVSISSVRHDGFPSGTAFNFLAMGR